jgi:hypothetical protein
MGHIPLFQPIACVSWVFDEMRSDGSTITHRGPHWGVGFYSPDQVPLESVVEIAGIRFIFGADDARRLNGATLDVVNGRFVVNERAI